MKFFVWFCMLWLTSSTMAGEPLPQFPQPPPTPPVREVAVAPRDRSVEHTWAPVVMQTAPEPTYAEAYAEAMAHDRPLVTFIGQACQPLPGCAVGSTPTLRGYEAPCVVIGHRRGDEIYHDVILPGRPSLAEIRQALERRTTAPLFSSPPPAAWQPVFQAPPPRWATPPASLTMPVFSRGGGGGC